MPQMMPIYWFVIFLFIYIFMYSFFSFYYYNLVFFSVLSPGIGKKSFFKVSFLK